MSFAEDHDPESVLDAIDSGLIVLGADGRVVAWNAWIAATSGVAPADALGRDLFALIPTLAGGRLQAAVEDALVSGLSSVLTHSLHPRLLPLRTRLGQALVHNVSVRRLGHHPARCLIQVADVTIATERERVLRERQNARYDAVINSAPDAIFTFDAQGVIQLANPAAARQFGYAAEALVGQPMSVIFPEGDPWASAWARLWRGEALLRPIALKARRADGAETHLEVSASPWQGGARTFVTAVLRDVNERQAAEAALRDLNQTLERRVAERTADRDRMWRLSSDVMVVTRDDGVITATNPAWKALLGWEEDALIDARLTDFAAPEDRAGLTAALEAITRDRAPRLFQARMLSRDGGPRYLAWSAVASDGHVQAVGRDVTAERETQAALLRAEEALRQSQKMEALGQLTGGIAHDFNNLLTGILGSMDILKRRLADQRYGDVDRFIEAAATSANRAAALTHRLLAFARRQPLNFQALDVNRLIVGMEDLLRRSLGERVSLRIDLAADLWPTLTDANQLENALLNLAINGRDAMPDGGTLTIATANTTVGAPAAEDPEGIEAGDYCVISVTDTGVGMSAETIARAFDPFFTTKPIGEGTGLGLSMIYGFAKQSRGHARIESRLGEGATVRLLLPRHQGAPASEDAAPAAAAPAGAGETVLLVEDDPGVRLLIGEVLRELGYASHEAHDGQAALALLDSALRIDLMVTDVGLPGMNGRQLAEMARQRRPGLKVLFVTGYAEHATERGRFLAPGMDMVTKPFSLDALAVKIRAMIGGDGE